MHEKEFFYTDNIREAGIRAALGQELRDLPLQVLPVVDSTNIRLRKMAEGRRRPGRDAWGEPFIHLPEPVCTSVCSFGRRDGIRS